MSHKVAYILVTGTPDSPGLHRTLESKISELSKIFPGSTAVCFLPRGAQAPVSSPSVVFETTKIWPKQLVHLLYPQLVHKWMRSQEGAGSSPDTIIIRSVVPSPLMALYFRNRTFVLLTDHHTKTEAELSLLFRLPHWLVSWVLKILRGFSERVTDGKLAVTHEIAESESFQGPIHVLGNPLSDEPVSREQLSDYDGQEIRLIMPVSKDFPWHGQERLVASARGWLEQNQALKVHIDIVGAGVAGTTEVDRRFTVSRRPTLSGDSLAELVQSAHLGVSSLALYKQRMRDACPLKSRLFIALGLPFIYAYKDPDLAEDSPVGLALTNDGSLIPLQLVADYLEKIYSDQDAYFDEVEKTQKKLASGTKMRSVADFVAARHSQVLGDLPG